MLQFFLKTFGEGITNIYLRPYNEKIWKFDPSFMNTDMVERIPKPTQEEIRRSAKGETVDGYLHQLYFKYPTKGGINALISGMCKKIDENKVKIQTQVEVSEIIRKDIGGGHIVRYDIDKCIDADVLISTIPVQELIGNYRKKSSSIISACEQLHYNSIIIAFVRIPYDHYGDHFTYTIPSKDIIFHRVSKMDYLGDQYHKESESTYIVEITYKPAMRDIIGSNEEIINAIKEGMVAIKAATVVDDIEVLALTDYQYAYVVYDMNHKENMILIRKWFKDQGVYLHGRFGNFEYWNMDRIILETDKLMEVIKKENTRR